MYQLETGGSSAKKRPSDPEVFQNFKVIMVVKGHSKSSKSKQAAFLTTLIVCNGVHCVKVNVNSCGFNERTQSTEQKALLVEPVKIIAATITPTPIATSTTATTRKPSKPPVHPSTVKMISDGKENESSASSDYDADSEELSSCKNQIYTALMKRIPIRSQKCLMKLIN